MITVSSNSVRGDLAFAIKNGGWARGKVEGGEGESASEVALEVTALDAETVREM